MIEDKIKTGIYEVMNKLNINHMPTSKEVRRSKIKGLESWIQHNGGYVYWAEKLNLSLLKPTTKWDEDTIRNSILDVVSILNINRMPTRVEIESVEKNSALTNIISKTDGFYGWAKKLNLEIKDSETKLGDDYENCCLNLLISKGYEAEHTGTLAPYDILVNKKVRIDVKSGCAYDLKGSRCHTFNLEKSFPTCDLYIIFALNEGGNQVERALVIPSSHLSIQTLSIGANSKYNKYINKFEYIDKYISFYKSLN